MYSANSGYVGHSMSVRAKHAYDGGLLSKGKIKKSDLKDAGINIPVNFIKWMMPNIITPSEWHHTSKHLNKTDFYDLEDIKEQLENINIESHLNQYNGEREKERLEKDQKQQEKGYYAFVEYGEWGGSRKHSKLTHYKSYVFIKGNWAYICDIQKKKIDGNHFEIIKIYKRKPREMSTKTRDNIFTKLKLK